MYAGINIITLALFSFCIILLVANLTYSKKTGIQMKTEKIDLKEYEKYYDKTLIDEEVKRLSKDKEFKEKKISAIIVLIMCTIPWPFFLIREFDGENYAQIIMFIVFYITIVILLFLIFKNDQKTHAYKSVVIKKMLEEKYPNSLYMPEKGISFNDYAFKEYVSPFNRYNNEDYISFTVNEKRITLSELETARVTKDSKGNSRSTITFRGIVGYYELNKTYEINQMYLGDNERFYKSIKLDNEEFNKEYYLVCDNEISSYKLLTPTNMERLIKLKDKIPTIELLLTDNRLYFRFENKNILEYKKDINSSSLELYKLDMLLKTISNICIEIEKELNDKI